MGEWFEALGERLTGALLTGDYDLYRSLVELPLRIEAAGAYAYTLADEAALREDLRLYHDVLRTHCVTDIDREVREMRPEADGRLTVVCRVNILANANRIVEPFQSETLIVERAGTWRISRIVSHPGHIDWTLGRAAIDTAGNFVRR